MNTYLKVLIIVAVSSLCITIGAFGRQSIDAQEDTTQKDFTKRRIFFSYMMYIGIIALVAAVLFAVFKKFVWQGNVKDTATVVGASTAKAATNLGTGAKRAASATRDAARVVGQSLSDARAGLQQANSKNILTETQLNNLDKPSPVAMGAWDS